MFSRGHPSINEGILVLLEALQRDIRIADGAGILYERLCDALCLTRTRTLLAGGGGRGAAPPWPPLSSLPSAGLLSALICSPTYIAHKEKHG